MKDVNAWTEAFNKYPMEDVYIQVGSCDGVAVGFMTAFIDHQEKKTYIYEFCFTEGYDVGPLKHMMEDHVNKYTLGGYEIIYK